jgi:hypothetical protein
MSETAAATAARVVHTAAAAREDTLARVARVALAPQVVLALAAAAAAVENVLLTTSAAAAAVMAFMDKALTGPAATRSAVAAAVGLVALAAVPEVIFVADAFLATLAAVAELMVEAVVME